jgi:hypothetical protein
MWDVKKITINSDTNGVDGWTGEELEGCRYFFKKSSIDMCTMCLLATAALRSVTAKQRLGNATV